MKNSSLFKGSAKDCGLDFDDMESPHSKTVTPIAAKTICKQLPQYEDTKICSAASCSQTWFGRILADLRF